MSKKTTFQNEGFSSGAEGGSGLVRCGSLLSLSQNSDEERKAKTARNRRYKLLRELSRNVWNTKLPMHQARHCSQRAIPSMVRNAEGTFVKTKMPGTIQVQKREETSSHSYHGISRCASALVCPVCSAIIQVRRAQEVMTAGEYLLSHGFQVAMITQTASHSRKTSLYDFIQRFQAAQHDMKAMRQYKNWQVATGAKFTIRAVETTDDKIEYKGRKSGWHFHSHTLMFFEREKSFTKQEVAHFTQLFQKMWVKALENVGLSGSLERAAQVDLPRANDLLDSARLSDDENSLKKLCAYISKAFGWEVSGSRNKKSDSEKDRRISVWQLQEAALTTNPELLPRYGQYMRAVKGLNWLRWSQGLKAFCGITDITDEELLKGEQSDETIFEFTDSEFKFIWRQAGQGKILDAADRAGAAGVAKALEAAMANCDIETGEELKNDLKRDCEPVS